MTTSKSELLATVEIECFNRLEIRSELTDFNVQKVIVQYAANLPAIVVNSPGTAAIRS